MTTMNTLRISDNYGSLVMRDVTITESEYRGNPYYEAIGTVVSGGITNRLFHATHTKPYPVGETFKYELYGRYPVQLSDGTWFVDCHTCG